MVNNKIASMSSLMEQTDSSRVTLEKKLDAANREIATSTRLIERLNANSVEFKKELESSNVKTADLTDRFNTLAQLHVGGLLKEPDETAHLTPGSDGYSRLNYGLGVVTVVIKDITPYANGTKVTLRFGNVLSATINGLKVNIESGPVDEFGAAQNDAKKTKVVTFVESLNSGSWTDLYVVLEGIRSDQLGFVRLKDATYRGIGLTGP